MKKSITLITMLLLLAVSFVSCGKKDEPVLPLNVISVTPVNNAAAIDFRPTITINFDKAVDNTTISGIQLLNSAGVSISINVTVNEKIVSLVPKADLSMGTKYTVKVSGVKATDSGVLASEFTSVFTTITPLTVVSVTPTNNSTSVDYRPTIKIDFDKDVDKNSISGIQLLNPAGTSVSSDVTVSAKSVSLVPKADLDMGIKYTIKVSGVKATDLGVLASDFSSVFTVKTVPLTIVSITPADKSVNVVLNAKIIIVFSKKLKSNVIDFITLTPASGTATWSSVYDGNVTVTITPTGGMVKNMNYYISYFAGITALDGEVLPTQAEYRITTGNF